MKVFVFPLSHILLYPGTSKPLHIFEPRYIQMVHNSLREKTPIAIGFVDDANQSLNLVEGTPLNFVREIVGFGLPQILESRPDGTLLVLLPGQGKARLGNLREMHKPYLVCEAEEISEQKSLSNDLEIHYLTLQKLLLSWLQTNIPDSKAREEFRRHLRSPEQIVGCVANYLLGDPDLQQLILEVDQLDTKVNLLSGMIGCGQRFENPNMRMHG